MSAFGIVWKILNGVLILAALVGLCEWWGHRSPAQRRRVRYYGPAWLASGIVLLQGAWTIRFMEAGVQRVLEEQRLIERLLPTMQATITAADYINLQWPKLQRSLDKAIAAIQREADRCDQKQADRLEAARRPRLSK